MKTNNFDEKILSKYDIRRKWDYELIKQKFGSDVKEDFIPLWIADMDFYIPSNLQNTLVNYITNSNLGYTSLTDDFYNSIINWQSRRHLVDIKKEWINITYGTVSALHVLNKALLKANEKVLILTPSYEPFKNAAVNTGFDIVTSSLINKDNKYYIDYLDIENKASDDKVKLFILCNPHNPSGRIWTKEEIERVAQICYDNNVILISDEVHSEMVFNEKHYSSLSISKKYLENLIFLTSPNKAFNLGGLKTSYSIIPNKVIREKIEKEMKRSSITSPNIIGLISLISAYNECELWLDDVCKYINTNYNLLHDFVKQNMNLLQLHDMKSSYLAWIDLSLSNKDSKYWTDKLAKAGVLVEDGNDFIKDGENFIRINLGLPRTYLEKALDRMKVVYDEIIKESK